MKKLFTLILTLLLFLALIPNAFADDMVFADDMGYGDCISQETGENLGEHDFQLVGGKAATCTDEGKQIYQCTKCGNQYPVFSDRLSATGEHTYVEKIKDGNNCNEPQIRYDECTVCGDIANEVPFGEPKGHTYVKDYSKEPTCTENGFVYYVCSTCGYYYPEPDILPKTGHDYEETERIDATCTGNGHVTYACTYCGIPYTKYLWATGHDYKVVTKAATCTEAGYSYKECTNCGKIIDKTTIEALGHDWSNNSYYCSRCGYKLVIEITFSTANITKAPEEEKKEEEPKEEEKQEEIIVIIPYEDEEEEEPLTRRSIQEDCPHEIIDQDIGDFSESTTGEYIDESPHSEYKCRACGKIWNKYTHYFPEAQIKRNGCHYTATCNCLFSKTYTLHDHITSAVHYTGKKSVRKVNGKAKIVYEVEVYRYCTTCGEKTENTTWYVSSKDSWTDEWSVVARNLYYMEDEYPEIESYWPQEVRRFIKKSKTQLTRN